MRHTPRLVRTAYHPAGHALAAALLLVGACRARPVETRTVVVTATPAPTVEAPVVFVEPTLTPAIQSAEFSFTLAGPTELPTITPTAAVIAESALEPHRAPTPGDLHEQLVQCLVFEAEKDPRPVTTLDYHAVVARVKARNDCDESLPGEEAWIEVRAIVPIGGRGVVGREYARFPGPIPARASAETVVRIENEKIEPYEFYRFEVALWWAAGSGRRPE